MQQLSQIVLKNSAIGMAAQMAIKVLSFIFTVVVVRQLGPDSYGQYAGVLAFGALFLFISDLGLSPYLVREVARLRDTPDATNRISALYSNVLILRILLSLLAGVLMVSAAWLTGRPTLMVGAIALNAIGVVLYSIHGSSDAVLVGYERIDISSFMRVVNQVVFVALGALTLWLGFGYYGLIIATLIGIAIMTWFCWTSLGRLGISVRAALASTWPGLLRASLPFGLIGLTLGFSYKFDSVLLSIYRGDAETGHYNAAYNLVFSAVMISNVLNTALYPSLSRQVVTDSRNMAPIYERILRYLLIVALPIAVGISVLASDVVTFLYDTSYASSIPVLQIIIWVVPLMYLSEFLGYVVLIGGKEHAAARSVFISTGVNVLANLIVIPQYGLNGAAIITVVTEGILVLQYLWILRATLHGINWMRAFVLPGVAAMLMGGIALLLAPTLILPLNALICAGLYGLMLIATHVIGPDELRFVRNLRMARKPEALS